MKITGHGTVGDFMADNLQAMSVYDPKEVFISINRRGPCELIGEFGTKRYLNEVEGHGYSPEIMKDADSWEDLAKEAILLPDKDVRIQAIKLLAWIYEQREKNKAA